MLVSVIVVNYNGRAFLDKCLGSLRRQSYPSMEVLLVDNGSSDGSVEFARKKYPEVKVIENGENLGFAKANNVGIRAARGELVATLNNDTEASPGWLEALVGAMLSEDNVGMCASKMLRMDDPSIIDSTGICISRSGACWDRGMFERDRGQYEAMEEVFGPCAGAALYRRSMLDEVGMFDEDFVSYLEDTDLAFRGRLAGWKCLYVPKAVVYHVHGGTAGYVSPYTVYYGNRNIVWYPFKDFPLPLLLTSLPFIVGRSLGVIPYYMAKGYGSTILKSKLDALTGIPKMLRKRRKAAGKGDINKFIRTWADIKKPPEAYVKPAAQSIHQ
ncbi:glycosyltransferase family 2 protein [Methanocella conradii]|uniref:glycosyltransferase family 2 protein n=1 Tax=Methanocella conradii TaxID=1175444 RepID=UPI0024B36F71|nr:glycosyltransferase family 2 protein [Methanocella conradii]MDI6896843.1 glycosyltransferase family 2 protein [Methanocella conradii]